MGFFLQQSVDANTFPPGVSQHCGSRNHKEELKTPYPGANKIQAEENQVTDLREFYLNF